MNKKASGYIDLDNILLVAYGITDGNLAYRRHDGRLHGIVADIANPLFGDIKFVKRYSSSSKGSDPSVYDGHPYSRSRPKGRRG